jgi:NNP family nitrate/nitrite transporter-like MFS transporter
MGFKIATLWQAPEINPVNGKARSIPILNPINKYGRVFVSDPLALWVWISQQDMNFSHDLHLPIYLP